MKRSVFNPYIPFRDNGKWTGGAKNAVEYYVGCERRKLLNKFYEAEKEINWYKKSVKKLEQKINDQNDKIDELNHRIEIHMNDDSFLAESIISDEKRNILSYFKEIEKILRSDQVTKNQLKEILKKFGENKKKEVKNLKERLIERINEMN